ncbi:MAG: hypothetical protein QJR02_10800 [Sinobacteraceae bacterium]|nr:hypothetical protein [Nevskiaceae bacterium]
MLTLTDLANPAVALCLLGTGVFFLTGLLTGVWKYAEIVRSPQAQAPVYVDIAHRASLLYSFAALLLAQFARLSAWPMAVNLWAAAAPLVFFALAIVTYIAHGILRDTDNQLRPPYVLGRRHLPSAALHGFMGLLMIAEIGGAGVLIAGTLRAYLG